MKISVEEIVCKSALTGAHGSYRLNPYIGCQHRCVYCYATFISRWRGRSNDEWGNWVQVKVNIPYMLERQLRRRKGIHVFLSTVCDVYQPLERRYEITRRCLEVLCHTAQTDPALNVFLLTKSDMVLRDIDVLRQFPKGSLRIAFSITTHRDDIAVMFEPASPRPSHRISAARALKDAGLTVGILINPILPYITERDLPTLLNIIEDAHLDFVGFDTLNYICGHVGNKVRPVYERIGGDALKRLEQAAREPSYERELRHLIKRLTQNSNVKVEAYF